VPCGYGQSELFLILEQHLKTGGPGMYGGGGHRDIGIWDFREPLPLPLSHRMGEGFFFLGIVRGASLRCAPRLLHSGMAPPCELAGGTPALPGPSAGCTVEPVARLRPDTRFQCTIRVKTLEGLRCEEAETVFDLNKKSSRIETVSTDTDRMNSALHATRYRPLRETLTRHQDAGSARREPGRFPFGLDP
jgi:hypothetical protein